MSMAVGPNQGIKNEINVTPLVDVVLVLLIIFMVVTPMLQRGKDVRLPKAQQIEKDDKKADPIIVSVTPDKHLYVEHDLYDDKGFEQRLKDELGAADSPQRRSVARLRRYPEGDEPGEESRRQGNLPRGGRAQRRKGKKVSALQR